MDSKKILFLLILCLLCFVPLNNVGAVAEFDYDIGSNGDGLDTSGSSGNCSVEQGCVHTVGGNDYMGVRVTLVNQNGNIISGTHSMDFWNTIPYNARAKSGSKHRSDYINNFGRGLDSDSFTAIGTYATGNVTDDSSLIGGISYKNQHQLIEDELRTELENYKQNKNCDAFKLLNLLGYKNFCDDITNPECEETLNNLYILIEPMYYVNYKKKNVAVTGTELAAMIYNTRIKLGDKDSTKNLNKSAFDNAITNMYLTAGDDQYDFMANNKIYNTFEKYANDLTNINIINYYNSGDKAQKVLEAAIGINNDLYPLGNSMHLVWLGTFSGNYCDNKCEFDPENPDKTFNESCCDDENYVEAYYSYWENHKNEINGDFAAACCDSEEYVKSYYNHNKLNKTFIDACCFSPNYRDNFPDKEYAELYIKQYCEAGNRDCDCEDGSYVKMADGTPMLCEFYKQKYCSCSYNLNPPKIETGVCQSNGESATSTFADGHYSSDYNKFLPLFYQDSKNSMYAVETKINDYCQTYCQERVVITLPRNNPYVDAGRYFTWTIADGNENFVEMLVNKNCATNIELDKWKNDYFSQLQFILAALNNSDSQEKINDKINTIKNTMCSGQGYYINKDVCNAIYDFQTKNDTTSFKKLEQMCNLSQQNCEYYGISEMLDKIKNKYLETNPNVSEYGRNVSYTALNTEAKNALSAIQTCKDGVILTEAEKNEIRENANNGNSGEEIKQAIQHEKYISDLNDFLFGEGDLPKTESQYAVTESDIENYLADNADAAVEAVASDRVKDCVEGHQKTLMNLSVIFAAKGYRCETDYDTKFDCPPENSENIVPTLEQYINKLKECQPKIDNEDNSDFDVSTENTLQIELGYQTQNSEKKIYSNSDFDITNKKLPSTVINGCNPVNLESDDECNPKNVFESYYCGFLSTNSDLPKILISANDITKATFSTENMTSYWKSYYFTTNEYTQTFKLKDSINACVCVDGSIKDANEDGTCSCDVETYTEYTVTHSEYGKTYCKVEWESKTYPSYYKVSEGNFSVEFMNPSGYYPLELNYSNIGSKGHFSELLKSGFFETGIFDENGNFQKDDSKTVNCDEVSCYYSDEDNVCFFTLDNKVLIDNGKIEDFICGDDECPPMPVDDDDVCVDPPCNDVCEDGECKVGGLEIIYRQVDLDNPFPDRSPGRNWINEENSLTEIITNNRGVEGNKLYSSNIEPLYSVTMTPAIIKEIRKVNAALGYDYAHESTMIYGTGDSNGVSYIYGVSGVLRDKIRGIVLEHGEQFKVVNESDNDDRFTAIIEIADDGLNCNIDGVTE